MRTRSLLVVAACSMGLALNLAAGDEQSLDPHLEPLRPLLGKTWRGEFVHSKPQKPTVDVSHWERALNGKAIRSLHSINDGVYGGETLFIWDDAHQTISYHYFTTEGFTTQGTMTVKDGKFITDEKVTGDADGVTEVRATSEFLADGGFHVKAEYFAKGEWKPGHEATYRVTPGATVNFN